MVSKEAVVRNRRHKDLLLFTEPFAISDGARGRCFLLFARNSAFSPRPRRFGFSLQIFEMLTIPFWNGARERAALTSGEYSKLLEDKQETYDHDSASHHRQRRVKVSAGSAALDHQRLRKKKVMARAERAAKASKPGVVRGAGVSEEVGVSGAVNRTVALRSRFSKASFFPAG